MLKPSAGPLALMETRSTPVAREPRDASSSRIQSATLFCESCARLTAHRILRLDRRGRTPGGSVRGVARCRECRLTHPFASAPEERVDVALIVSSGATSERRRVSLPRFRKLQVGSGVPDSEEPLVIHRIDDRSGRPLSHAAAGEITTVWTRRDEGAVVAVSIVEGRRTRPVRVTLAHETVLRVGDELRVESEVVEIVGLRARGNTWRRPGDQFSVDEVARVYGRRSSMPPAGRSPWRRVRVSPSSRTRSTSTASRPRSAPGTRTARSLPRVRIADGGAAVQSVSPL